jgi:cellulose synthase/poly-beta-1,6-N-acetylglucosamine synthase-like glycosyltransferase
MSGAVFVLVLSVATLAYVYVGYPLVLKLLVAIRGRRQVRHAPVTPSLTLIISAYNEVQVIRRKLDNALSLLYPPELLNIVVISDASDDGTDAAVAEYAGRGVTLARQPRRGGKTAGLNHVVPTLTTEIVCFSDANAMYEPDALLKLARNFADPDVGCVTGEARYLPGGTSAADIGERVYWDYEIQIKRLETALGSTVGGDGAIYAIRRELWRELPENAINDFLNPLQIVEAGWRAVYEPEAVCHEETAGGIRTEYRRRVRIVSRSWRAVFQAPGVWNPFRTGLFVWSLLSHKILRWLSGIFAAMVLGAAAAVFVPLVLAAPVVAAGGLVVLGVGLTFTTPGRRLLAVLAYFATIYAASFVGVMKGSFGKVSGVWATTRQQPAIDTRRWLVPVGILLQVGVVSALVGTFVLSRLVPPPLLAAIVFWVSAGILLYVYFGYAALLAVLRLVMRRPINRAAIEPRVCVFIAAHNERAVIAAKLRNTLALDYPADRLDIVVASDGSTDGTNDIVRAFAPRVRLLEFFPRRGKIGAINEGVQAVGSEIVVFSDANTFLQPDAVRALVRNFADPDVGGVSGDVVLVGERAALGSSEDLYYRYERWLQHVESEIGSMVGADGALYAIRRELFQPPPADTILDDLAIPMAVVKAGRRVVFEGAARAYEQGSETAREEFSRKSRVVAGAIQFISRSDSAVPLRAPQVIFSLVSHKALRWFSPAFGTAAFVCSLVLFGSGPQYTAAAVIQSALIMLGVSGCLPSLRRSTPVAIAHYFCLLQAAAAFGFLRGVARRQSVLWRRFDRAQSPATLGTVHD